MSNNENNIEEYHSVVKKNHAPVWLFGITNLPFGVIGGFTAYALPYFLRKQGVSVENIAYISSLTMLPSAYQFLWAPIIDVGFKRRTWLMIFSVMGSISVFLSLFFINNPMGVLFLLLLVLGQGLCGLVGTCNGAIMATTLPDNLRGRAAGWVNAGNLGGGALGAGLTMFVLDKTSSLFTAGLLLVLLIVLPAFAAMKISETKREKIAFGSLFRLMLRDIWSTLKTPKGFTGVIICLSPVGTAAAMGLFTAIAVDYKASSDIVTFATGFGGGLLTAVGAVVGGILCDKFNKRIAYILAGVFTAISCILMYFGPMEPFTYLWGSSLYLLVAGFCYSAFTALVLDVIGNAGSSAATQYTLFSAAGNQAIAYTMLIDGWGYQKNGAAGMLLADATANMAGVVFLIIMFTVLKKQLASNKG